MPTYDVNSFSPRSGRVIKSNGEAINVGDGYPLAYNDVETLQIAPLNGVDGCLHIMAYTEAIAQGLIAGHSIFRGFGERSNATNIVNGNDVWQGSATTCPIPNQSTGERMTLASTSAADASAGTGIKSVDVHYLDADGNPQQEVVVLAGLTPVNTVATDIRFIQSIHAETVGAGGVAAGTISIYKFGDAATVYNVITPGGNMSLNAARMIPNGKTFYMMNLSVMATDNTPVSVRLRSTSTFEDALTDGNFFLYKDVSTLENSTREKSFKVPLKFPAFCILKFTAYSATNGASIAVNYDGWIE